MDLPTLSAMLHWTYDAPKSTLSMAYTAPSKDGWVAWALNPTTLGMVGSQALMAFQPKPASPITVNTVDIASYHSVEEGPISYTVTAISGEEASGKITLFGTWVLQKATANMVWQVGPISDGKPAAHAMEQANFMSKKTINFAENVSSVESNVEPTSSSAPAPWTMESVKKTNGAVGNVVSIVSVFGALFVSLF